MEAIGIGSGSRPYQCRPCGKRVHSMSALQQHTRIHRNSCPYQCSVCSKSFRLLTQLRNHQDIHVEKPFTCNWCETSFVEQYQLGQHLFREHRIIANGLESQFPNLVNQVPPNLRTDTINNNHSHHKDCPSQENSCSKTALHHMTPDPVDWDDFDPSAHGNIDDGAPIEYGGPVSSVFTTAEEASHSVFTANEECASASSSQNYQVIAKEAVSSSSAVNINSNLLEESTCLADLRTCGLGQHISEDRLPSREFPENKSANFFQSQDIDLDPISSSNDKQMRLTQGNLLVNDEDSLINGSIPDNSRFMLRGDPSLHRCQSGDDLFMFGSLMFIDEKDSDSKLAEKLRINEAGLSASTWSSSNLSSLVLPNTPHKLSVDPGANSVNVSPAMSPFRASIGQGDSDSESESVKLKDTVIKSENEIQDNHGDASLDGPKKPLFVAVDKESSVSPCHDDFSVKLPIQPDTITFKRSPDMSPFTDIEKLDNKSTKNHSRRSLKTPPQKLSRLPVQKTDRTSRKASQRNRTKSASSTRRKSTAGSDKEWNPSYDVENECDISTEKPSTTRTRRKSVKLRSQEPDETNLEYNLRPKRRKTFQSLFHDTCECCMHSGSPAPKTVNVQHYVENVTKVEKLRKQVTQLLGTVFPDLKFPPRFSDDGIGVEYLMNEVADAASERQRNKQGLVPFGTLDGEVRVVLCKYPLGCLRHFRRKISRLLTTLLPDIKTSELEVSGATVDDLLTQVIDMNRQEAAEQLQVT